MQEQIEHYSPAKLKARASELRQCIASIKADPEMHGKRREEMHSTMQIAETNT